MLALELGGLFEEAFSGDGEELGGVGCAVVVEHCGSPERGIAAEPVVLGTKNACPGRVLAAALEDRGPVGRAVLLVELMGELV